ncbi:MAG: AAA family ATPase, partial [Phaeodactylibacter sp.]|nr:AAA family ATPase [Phaeodactylibacter sp.]
MLIEFRASNYRSIAEEQILSLVPSKGQGDYVSNIFTVGNFDVLNGAALYGPNNGGKSNLLRALRLMDNFLFTSSKLNSTAPLPYDPNLLIAGYHEKPTGFEVTFLIDTVRYRYGFQFDRKSVHREWLYRKKVGREVELFYREADVIEVSSGLDGKTSLINTAIEATRSNGLFLSFCDMLNVDEAKKIFAWFKRLIHVDGLDTSSEEINTISLIESSEDFKHKILTYLNRLGFNFSDIEVLRKH